MKENKRNLRSQRDALTPSSCVKYLPEVEPELAKSRNFDPEEKNSSSGKGSKLNLFKK
jgi:hypothetical protein